MADKQVITTSGGIGCGGVMLLLGLIFITLKLTGHIAWSWWWVLSPFLLYGGFIVCVLGVLGTFLLCAVIYELVKD